MSIIKTIVKATSIAVAEAVIFLFVFVLWSAFAAYSPSATMSQGAASTSPIVWHEAAAKVTAPPESFVLAVPFTPQAPFANWSQPWQDFCEEAITVMAADFSRGATSTQIAPARARDEMLNVMRFELKTFGYHKDTGAQEIAVMLERIYGVPAEVKPVSSPADIRNEILNYHIVVLPLAGKELQNPMFKPPGPLYHTILVKGYDNRDNVFIANEPGTRLGNNFRYDQNLIFQALANWDQKNRTINNNERVMVVVGYK